VSDRKRGDNLAKDSDIKERLGKVHTAVKKGFDDQKARSEDIAEFWKIYNTELGPGQLYSGRNRLYAPFVYEAIQARATRFVNQLFPQTERHVEAFSEDGTIPRAGISICEHYVSETDLRSVVEAMCVSGDVEGQYNLYCTWEVGNRRTASRVKQPVTAGDTDIEVGSVDDVVEEDEPTGGPCLELLSDTDVCILPATAQSADAALSMGGSVSIMRRWGKREIENLKDKGDIDEKLADDIIDNIEHYKDDSNTIKDVAKDINKELGITKDGRGCYANVLEIWTELKIDDEYRLCQCFIVGECKILMARRNPYWSDVLPLFTAPLDKTFGSNKGASKIAPVKKIQYFANDVLNEMADSANYTLLPITMRDPAYITSPLILAPGAVWDVPPNGASFATMPPLWEAGSEILQALKAEIFQVLSVNSSMVTQSTKKKQNQAEVAQEQQIDLLTTGDSVRVIKDNILNRLMNFFMALDYQFRDKKLTVREYGEFGIRANLDQVPPFQLKRRTTYYWVGDELIKGAQQIQQKIGFMNVLMKLPPQLTPHYTMNMEPIILDAVETIYGPRLGRMTMQDMRSLLSMDPETENQLMDMGHTVQVHPTDNTEEHIASHTHSLQADGDEHKLKATHILEHRVAAQQQLQAQQQQGQEQPGQDGGKPGGSQGPPSNPGGQPGAMPAQGRPAQQPPGAIHADRIGQSDPSAMPRRG